MSHDRSSEPTFQQAEVGARSADPDGPASDPDTQGHSLFVAEFGRQMANSRVRETEDSVRTARHQGAARKAPKPHRRWLGRLGTRSEG